METYIYKITKTGDTLALYHVQMHCTYHNTRSYASRSISAHRTQKRLQNLL